MISMNKEQYKKTMSEVYPSDDTVEKILRIPNGETAPTQRRAPRPLLIAAAVLALLTAAGLTANAATDGALLRGIGRFVIEVFVGGERQTDPRDTVKKLYAGGDENGNAVVRFGVVPPEGVTDDVRVVFEDGNEMRAEIVQSPDGKSSFEMQIGE